MPTRMYFPLTTAADVSPAFNNDWIEAGVTAQAVRRFWSPTKGGSALSAGTTIDGGGLGPFMLDRQYVSPPLQGDQTIGGGFKGQLMVREFADDDDVMEILISLRVVSQNGQTTRGYLTPAWHGNGGVEHFGSGAEAINNATHRNKAIALSGSTFGASVAGLHGDRLVLEIGHRGNGVTPQASAKWGETGTDLPENETQTSDGVPWFEFAQTITFQPIGGGEDPSATYAMLLRVDGSDVSASVALTASDAFYRTPYFQPTSVAQLDAMEIGAMRGPESPAKDIQVEDMWRMLEYVPIGAPAALKVDLKQFRRRLGSWR